MWTFIIGFLIGGLIFGGLGFVIGNSKSNKVKDKDNKDQNSESNYIRRGIFVNEYSSGIGINKKSFEVQFELGELESTSTKSKVEVISMSASKSEFNNESTKKTLSGMINYTWLSSSDIEWIDDTSKNRNDKIDQILGK